MKRIKATQSMILPFSAERTQALIKANSKPKKPKSKANILTAQIVNYLTDKGHFATRLNSTGIVRNGQYTTSTQRNGLGDILAIINSEAVFFEVKIGTDKPSEAQLETARQVRLAGGSYFFIKCFEDFMIFYESLLNKSTLLF